MGSGKVTLQGLQDMKDRGAKIACSVVWDYQMARIVDRAGIHLVSVGDSVGVNLWGHTSPLEVTLDEMILVCKAVRRGVRDALLSCDFPYGPLQAGTASAVDAAIRLVKEAGVDMVKMDAAPDHLDAVSAVTRAGIPVFAQFGVSPQTALRHGVPYSPNPNPDAVVPAELRDELVHDARRLEEAGAVLLNFSNSGPAIGPEVVSAVRIPVLGGLGGGPWLDGRIRMAHAAIGYDADWLDSDRSAYANVARISHDAMLAFKADVEAARPLVSDLRADR